MLWGEGILVRWLTAGSGGAGGAYQSGQNAAVIFGLLMFAAGAYYLFKKDS